MNQPHDAMKMNPPPPYAEAPPPQPVMVAHGPMYQANVVPAVIPVVVGGPRIGPKASNMTCASCNMEIVTRVEYLSTTKTHLFAALLCLLGCWPCVCIPYCVDTCRNANHYCPNCNAYIGTYVN